MSTSGVCERQVSFFLSFFDLPVNVSGAVYTSQQVASLFALLDM
jgi:hypothetical protein